MHVLAPLLGELQPFGAISVPISTSRFRLDPFAAQCDRGQCRLRALTQLRQKRSATMRGSLAAVRPLCLILVVRASHRLGFVIYWACSVVLGHPYHPQQAQKNDYFELCGAQRHMSAQFAQRRLTQNLAISNSECSEDTIPIWPESTCAGVGPQECFHPPSCCPAGKLWCAGCGNASDSECLHCLGGFIKTGGGSSSRCEACMDTPEWSNKDGKNCAQIDECNDEEFNFLSSNLACCHCGGGALFKEWRGWSC